MSRKVLLVTFVILICWATSSLGGDMQKSDVRTYAFFYFMQGAPDAIGQVVPAHIEYWKTLQLAEFQGGPFNDDSGGMLVFQADNDAQAEEFVAGDPFVTHGLLSDSWLKAWQVH